MYQQQPAPAYQPAPATSSNNTLAIVSLIVGIVALLSSCCLSFMGFFGICSAVLGIVAVVLGAIGINQISKSGGMQTGKGMAIAGIVMGAVSILLPICVNIILVGLLPLMGMDNIFSNILDSI
jgi:hypothetical protein